MRSLVWAVAALAAVQVQAKEEERWDLSAPRVALRLNADLVRDLGFRVSPAAKADADGYSAFKVGADGRLVALATGSVFRTVESGELRLSGGPTFLWKGDSVSLRDAVLRPGTEPQTFLIAGADGSSLFYADHQHLSVDRSTGAVRLFNLDLRLTPELAARLGEPRHADIAVGVLEIEATAAIPKGSVEDPAVLGACTNPNWGAPHNDVALTGITPIQQVARANGFVAIAPSAILTNAGSTDVPWIAKFATPGPPYNVDQHPFLIWNMYRVLNGQIKQLGASGVKHAFLTVNTGCGCPSGAVLWVGCSDTYGVGTNNSTGSLSTRTEVTAHTGIWQRQCSIFDGNCDNLQGPTPPGFTGADDDRRMVVRESDLGVAGAQYFFDAWYVVRDDVNIFNTMGWVPVTLSFAGSTWSVSPGTKSDGAVVDAWVNPSAPGPNADNKRITTTEGRLTLAVRATDVGGGQWRYDYALMNHDFDRRIRSFSVPLPAGTATSLGFTSVNRNAGSAWPGVAAAGAVRWEIPGRPAREGQGALDWGNLNTFSFVSDRPPSAVGAVTVTLGVQEAPGGTVTVGILGPS